MAGKSNFGDPMRRNPQPKHSRNRHQSSSFVSGSSLNPVDSLIVMIFFLLSFYRSRVHKAKPKPAYRRRLTPTPVKSKEIQEIVNDLHVEIGKPKHRVVVYSDQAMSGESRETLNGRYETTSFGSRNGVGPEVSHLGLEGEQQHGQISNKKHKEIFPHGNHKNYYGYQIGQEMEEDARLKGFQEGMVQRKGLS
ncbi:hypothetical protein PS1_045082 [Malus domestica]